MRNSALERLAPTGCRRQHGSASAAETRSFDRFKDLFPGPLLGILFNKVEIMPYIYNIALAPVPVISLYRCTHEDIETTDADGTPHVAQHVAMASSSPSLPISRKRLSKSR